MKCTLLTEDDLTYAKIIRIFLEKNGFEVTPCETLKGALLEIQKRPYDLAITDYRPPNGTGMEFISKRIHEKSLSQNGPFVAVDCGTLSTDLAASELFGHVKGGVYRCLGQ
jgi:DNA-binding NtrC family response regulator